MTVRPEVVNTWFRRYVPAEHAAHRLVCFPHAGGSASYYLPLVRALAPEVDVVAVQYPGRQDRLAERCVDNFGELADVLAPMVRTWFDRPVAFLGHSMGATLAFELARRLEADGVVLSTLFASGRPAPSRVRDRGKHRLPDAELVAEVTGLDGTDPALLQDEDVIRMLLPVLRGDYRAAELYRYVPGPDLSCPVVTLVGADDREVSDVDVRTWGEHTTGPFGLHVFSGGHFYLQHHIDAVASLVGEHLRSQLRRLTDPDDEEQR